MLLSTTARTQKQPRCPSKFEWVKKLWYMYTMQYYSAIRRNAFASVLMGWLSLKFINQSKSEREKQILYMNAYIENLERWHG